VSKEITISTHAALRSSIAGVFCRAGVDPLTAPEVADRVLGIVSAATGLNVVRRVSNRRGTSGDANWRLLAAEWLDGVADAADAEGLTAPEITEDRKKLAQLLRQEAGG